MGRAAGLLAGARPPLELYRAIINPDHGFAPGKKKRKSPMSNPERTQHALFFELGRGSGKEKEKRNSMKNSASLSASPSLSSPLLPYPLEDKSCSFASVTCPAAPPAL